LKAGNSERLNDLLISGLIAIPLIIAFCNAYVAAEHPAYEWDYGAYWGYFKNYGNLISSGAPRWLSQFRQEISSLDYNPLAAVLLYPFYFISGDGRTSYVTGICLLYLLPAVVVASLVALRATPAANAFIIFVMAITYIPFWTPSLRGMVDIVGLIPLGLATILIFKTEFLSKRPISSAIRLALLVYLPFILRRWYAYSIITFLILAFVFGVVSRIQRGKAWPRAILSTALPFALTGMVAAALLLTLQLDLVKRVLSTSYADVNAAYQAPFVQHLTLFPGRLGWYFIPMMTFGAAVAIATRNVVATFCLLAATGTFFFFIQTQQMAEHHFLPVAFWLFPVYIVGAAWLSQWFRFPPAWARLAPFVVAGAAVSLLSIVPGLRKGGPYLAPFVPKYATFPLHLDNYSEYQRLLANLDGLLGKNGQVVVYSANGMAVSDSLLAALHPAITPHISYISYFPALTLFRFDNLRADYALVRSDDLRRYAPDALRNISIPGEMILSGTGIGAAYERVGSYTLSEGETAELFRRTRPIKGAEVKQLIDELGKAYGKDYSPQFQRTMDIPFALREERLGDVYGTVYPVGPSALFLHSGQTQPTSTTIPIGTSITDPPAALVLSVSKQLLQTCPKADGGVISVKLGSNDIWRGTISPADSVRVDLPATGGELNIVVDKRADPNCDGIVAAFEFAK
jgi:hypothetical protein